jgi:8-oxo-dGTP diphosphatase
VLLVERAREPLKGYWSLPGGVLEVGELAEDAVRREVLEETGLDIRVEKLVHVFERITNDADDTTEYHYVVLDYLCTPLGGELCAADDASQAAWVTRGELSHWRLTAGALPVIEKAFRLRSLNEDAD